MNFALCHDNNKSDRAVGWPENGHVCSLSTFEGDKDRAASESWGQTAGLADIQSRQFWADHWPGSNSLDRNLFSWCCSKGSASGEHNKSPPSAMSIMQPLVANFIFLSSWQKPLTPQLWGKDAGIQEEALWVTECNLPYSIQTSS